MPTLYGGIENLSPWMACDAKTVFATFEMVKASTVNLPSIEVMDQIPKKVKLTDWEKDRYEKTKNIGWQSGDQIPQLNA